MNIFKSIPNGIKLFNSVKVFNYYMKDIQKLRSEGKTEEERELIAHATSIWVDKVFDTFDIRLQVEGRENIPKDGACVFISNHQGYADIIVLIKALEGKQIGFIAKESLRKVPYFGKWIETIRGVFIKRGNAREALKSIQVGVDYLKEGFSMVIFPEGTRSHDSHMGEFKAGSFKLATKAKVPIVPVTINGAYKMFEQREVITGDVDIDVVIHPPIDTASLGRHEMTELHTKVEDIVREPLQALIERDKKREKK